MNTFTNICNICTENITKFRYEIDCLFCNFTACCDCVKRYILESSEDPCCMNCKKVWNRKFLSENFNKTFINKKLKTKREEILFDKEKALLPATQIFVEAEIRKEEINKQILELREQINELKYRVKELDMEKARLDNKEILEKDVKLFVKACPTKDCKGFLSKNWTCGLCKNKTCKDCHETEEDEHKCDPNNVETAKLLSKDTKGCPNCGTQIFKIEGCDQMYCTQCHTPFSWKTGKIEKGVIHNPHYFEWLRKNPNQQLNRNPLDVQCGRELDHVFIRNLSRKLPVRYQEFFTNLCRNIIHIREVEMRNFQIDRIRNNRDIRIKYMRNQITEEQFKKTLQKREKDILKRTEITELLQMLNNCATDIFYRLYSEDIVSISSYRDEFNRLEKYINKCFQEISELYNCKIYFINEHFKFF